MWWEKMWNHEIKQIYIYYGEINKGLNWFFLKITSLVIRSLAKVSDWNSFRVNQNYSDSLRYLYPSQCESFRTNPKTFFSCLMKNCQQSIRLNPINSIWINSSSDWYKPNFQSESIRMNPRSELFGLNLIENSVWINPRSIYSDWFVLKTWFWINSDCRLGINRMDFWPFSSNEIQNISRIGSQWFALARI